MAQRARAAVAVPPRPPGRPALVVLAGLPGSGKSRLAAALTAQRNVVMLRSDAVRKVLFPHPTYTPPEHGVVFQTCHALLRSLLTEGYAVLFEATNLTHSNRRAVTKIADEQGVPWLLVWVDAPEEVVRQRLAARAPGSAAAFQSDADWNVYLRLKATVELPNPPSLVADTHTGFDQAVAAVARWLDAPASPTPFTEWGRGGEAQP